jgi:hypothetical protein
MKLKELKQIIDNCCNRSERYQDLEVCIPNHKQGGMGGASTTKVKSASKGIDWDSGKFFIFPEVKMVERELKE